jgi:hypothetical protein
VKLRTDFRDPKIVGTFPFHCHIIQHVDGGMMGTVKVEPTLDQQQGQGIFMDSEKRLILDTSIKLF